MTKAIILAAGQGTRLRPLTDHIPKTMVLLDGIPMLYRQRDTLHNAGITDITVISGYQEQCIDNRKFNKIINPRYETTNMVSSLYCARTIFDGSSDIIIAYGDIVYEDKVITSLLNSVEQMNVVIDTQWKKLWSVRMDNPLEDAETLKLDDNGYIRELGKKPKSYADIEGQYIGLFKINSSFASSFFQLYESLDKSALYDGKDYNNMYMTSYIQLLINNGVNVMSVPVSGGWLEVDSVEDLRKYEELIKTGELSELYKLTNDSTINSN